VAQPTVCFVARTDFESKPGGDTVQWQLYDQAARQSGLQTTLWTDDRSLPHADVFHAFNVDRPLELYPKLLQVRRHRLPYIMSTIHHPKEWVLRFRRFLPPTGLLGRALYRSPLGRSLPATETIREAALIVQHRRLAHLGDLLPRWSRRVRWLLANASRVALLTPREQEYVCKDFAAEVKRPFVLPNWVEPPDEHPSERPPLFESLPEAPVLVVGRIEPRKNSATICRLADALGRPLVFVGRPHPSETRFVEAFAQAIRRSTYVHWIPGVPRSQVPQFYRHASFLLNAGLVEVSPLVDIEALAYGCPVATTRYALHHELLPRDTPTVDPYDENALNERLQWRPDRLDPTMVIDPRQCQRDLVQTYVDLASARVHPSDGS